MSSIFLLLIPLLWQHPSSRVFLLGDVSPFLTAAQRLWFVARGPTGGSDPERNEQAEASD